MLAGNAHIHVVDIDRREGFQLASRLLEVLDNRIHLVGVGQRQIPAFQDPDGIFGHCAHEQVYFGSPYVQAKYQVFLPYFILLVFIH